MKKDRYKTFSYEITSDPYFMDEEDNLTPELHLTLEQLFDKISKKKSLKKTIERLLKLIEKHPKNPQLKNYLSIAYMNMGDEAKSYEVTRWTLAEHPAYLYGKLNLASEYYEKGEYEKMPEVLGEVMEIQGLYPDRNKFHFSEVTAFNKLAVLYFAATGDLEAAGGRLEIMQEIAPDHPDTDFADNVLMKATIEKGLAIWEEEEKTKKRITPAPNTRPRQITEVPEIFNPLVIHLYENGLYIDDHLVNEILKLPRESLIADLELILNDLLCRYEFFRQDVEDMGWEEEDMSFPIHAIMLLGELRAEESLPKVLEVLRQDEEFLDFWFGDHITSTIWEPLYYLGNNQLDVLKNFVQEPGVDTIAKTTVSTAVSQIPYHQPERNEEVLQWFKEVLNFFINSRPEDNVVDSDTIGLIICDVIDLRYGELLPLIKDLFGKQYVSDGVCGDYKSIEKDIKKVQKYSNKEDLLNITERYENITNTWAGYREEDNDDDGFSDDDTFYDDYEDMPVSEPVRTLPKTGRNEPCPCGSGKKYKKCCLNKTT